MQPSCRYCSTLGVDQESAQLAARPRAHRRCEAAAVRRLADYVRTCFRSSPHHGSQQLRALVMMVLSKGFIESYSRRTQQSRQQRGNTRWVGELAVVLRWWSFSNVFVLEKGEKREKEARHARN
ncbi:hypothetical protein GGS23DRAFT_547667 [Durotheca rogersii]|uniref:uncharacterized protein n=1 Tax=Durotheca rogersii TaxID=419775 RepID=UPI00221FF957|nr:uncharacterized protein GGS23DRAFT_547667 [Durotheca rogersii]KAI5867286.1 hypothetical protein GGS23DRAFT_547667 [Durotheca rogersii]